MTVNTARAGRAREHRVRDQLTAAGWLLVARSAGSRGPCDLVVVHPVHGIALVQVGTRNKAIGPEDRARFLHLADLCGALPLVAVCAPGRPARYWVLGPGPARTWPAYDPTIPHPLDDTAWPTAAPEPDNVARLIQHRIATHKAALDVAQVLGHPAVLAEREVQTRARLAEATAILTALEERGSS